MSVTRVAASPYRTDEPALQQTRHRRLAPSRIRAGHNSMLPEPDLPALCCRESTKGNGAKAQQNPGQTSGDVIHQVVHSGAAPAKAKVSVGFVSHHRVHRAGDLEKKKPGQSREDIPEQGTQEPIDETFAETFNCRSPASREIHFGCIPANEHRDSGIEFLEDLP